MKLRMVVSEIQGNLRTVCSDISNLGYASTILFFTGVLTFIVSICTLFFVHVSQIKSKWCFLELYCGSIVSVC